MGRAEEEENRRLLRARDAIDRAYDLPLDLAALARIALVSEAHFIRRFGAVFGETPGRYLQRRRIERARALLTKGATAGTLFFTTDDPIGVHERLVAAGVDITDEQLAEIGQGAKTPAVKVTVNGGYTFDGRIGRMGGETLLGFNKAVRAAAGVEAGDELELTIALDAAPREVELPADLAAREGKPRR